MRRKEEKFFLNKKNKEKKLRPGQLYWELLKVIGMTLVSGGGGIMRPMLPIAIEEVIRITKEISKANIRVLVFRKALKNIAIPKLIKIVHPTTILNERFAAGVMKVKLAAMGLINKYAPSATIFLVLYFNKKYNPIKKKIISGK